MTPSYDVVSYASSSGSKLICSRCFNTEVAEAEGLTEFQHIEFEPVRLADFEGILHEFHFRTHLFGPGVSITAFEIRHGNRGGYEFQVIGNPEDDLLALLGQLISKMRRGLSVRHIESGDLGPQIADHRVVKGRVAWDSGREDHLPWWLWTADDYSWEEFGRMLMTFEGWQFKLSMHDISEEP